MVDILYPKDRRTTRNIGIGVLALLVLHSFGVLSVLGFNLATYNIAGFNVLNLLSSLGLLWVLIGIWRWKF